ncbi:MAG: hypothetical protein JWQ38_1875 [Flavipsychrobacter sp.]|nr:hypothetical protein [Flavipsychrobacter sp.]
MARSIIVSIKLSGILLLICVCSVVAHAQIITTLCGDGTRLFSGDGGPATAAPVAGPCGVITDAKGNVYIAAGYNNRVRMIDRSGIITTTAGSGCSYPCYGFTGDGGPATAATMGGPEDICFSNTGDMYLADVKNNRIRKINSAGIISTVAGNGGNVYNGDGIAATNAALNSPSDVVVDASGNLYINDWTSLRIRKVNSAGIISTLVGNGISGYSGDGGPATAAQISYGAHNLALDKHGNLFFSDTFCVRMINTAGIISTIAGTAIAGFSGDGGPATAAQLNHPYGIATDSMDNIYIAELGNSCIRKVNRFGIISTVAGMPISMGFSGDGGPATAALLNQPVNVYVDCGGNMYIADWWSNRVRMVTNNHAPQLLRGHSANLAICADLGTASLDTLLRILDIDTLQGETWLCPGGAHHGSVAAGYNISSTGDVLTPSGLTYTPASGYTGADTFMIVVTDCGLLSDTMMVYVAVQAALTHSAVSGADTVCNHNATTFTHGTPGGIWAASNSKAAVTGGIVTGMTTGKDTVLYTTSNACGSITDSKTIVVVKCPDGITSPRPSPKEREVLITPNPGNGSFSVLVTSAVNEQMQLTVTDITGKQIMETTGLTNKAGTINLHVSSGVYFLTARTAKGKYEAKVVVNP